MDAIARQADVSKATLYAHFASKEALFLAVMQSLKSHYQAQMDVISSTMGGSFTERLTTLAMTIMDFLLSPAALRMFRIVVAEGGRFPDIVPDVISAGREKTEQIVANVFRSGVASKELKVHDCAESAHLFMSMLRGDLLWEFLTDPRRQWEAAGVHARIDCAVQQFVRLYALKATLED
jgi:AcrR family transcriptional regulator